MNSISRAERKWKVKVIDKRKALLAEQEKLKMADDLDIRVLLIQNLITLGLEAVEETLQDEVKQLTGRRYKHGKEYTRWGRQNGSVYLADQKVPIRVSAGT